jgi:carnitine 3-dehydrogenase
VAAKPRPGQSPGAWISTGTLANGRSTSARRRPARLQAALWREAVNAVVSGLASVEDVDTAISAGPGLRWAVMGPHMTFHLGGGEGGITHMLEQFRPAFEAWWASMTTPELSEETCRKIIDGLAEEAHERSISELVRERDELLIPLLELVAKRHTSH